MNVGQHITLLKIDDALAMTHRYQLEVRSVLAPEPVGYEGRKQRVGTVRQKGKRKDFYLDLAADDIVIDGWDVPFVADTEAGGIFAGNACYNLVGDPDAIRNCLESRAVFPITARAKAEIIVSRAARTRCDDSETQLLYPDFAVAHAVIDRMKVPA